MTTTSHTFELRAPGVVRRSRPRRRRTDLEDPAAEGTPAFRLVGIALLGWFGVMLVVTALAV